MEAQKVEESKQEINPEENEEQGDAVSKWVGAGKEYILPVVTEDMLTAEALEKALDSIKKEGPESNDANKPLTKDLLEPLWIFTDARTPPALMATAFQWLGDSARVVHNRHLIGGLFKPVPVILRTIITQRNEESTDLLKQSIRLLANLSFDNPYVREKFLDELPMSAKAITDCLFHTNEEIQRITTGCVANLCSVTEKVCVAFQAEGCLDQLLKLVKSHDDNVQCMTARALRNICETEEIRLFLIGSGLFDYCINIMKDTVEDDGMVREFMGTLNALLQTKTAFTDFICKYNAIYLLLDLLSKATQVDLIADILDIFNPWAETPEIQAFFIAQNHVETVFNIFSGSIVSQKIEARVACGKICGSLCANDDISKLLFSKLSNVVALFTHPEVEIQSVAAVTLSNLARTDEFCAEMISQNIPTLLIKTMSDKTADMRIRHYSCSTLRNISIHPSHKLILLDLGVMRACVELLAEKEHHVAVFSAISVIKSLLTAENDKVIESYVNDGGLAPMIEYQNFTESDHVRFESCRVIALLYKKKNSAFVNTEILNKVGGLKSLEILASGKFDILKQEANEALSIAQIESDLEKKIGQ
jgi:hypothetical protein